MVRCGYESAMPLIFVGDSRSSLWDKVLEDLEDEDENHRFRNAKLHRCFLVDEVEFPTAPPGAVES